MAVPSWQTAADWVKEELVSEEWVLLRDVGFSALSSRWTSKSEEEIWDFIDEGLSQIAELLRNEVAEWSIDGVAPRFEIDNEQSPYLKSRAGSARLC